LSTSEFDLSFEAHTTLVVLHAPQELAPSPTPFDFYSHRPLLSQVAWQLVTFRR
jgi:hypothetical protein